MYQLYAFSADFLFSKTRNKTDSYFAAFIFKVIIIAALAKSIYFYISVIFTDF